MADTKVICIAPVKNESWILKNFIVCAQSWADLIIIGDNNSSDDSARIAQNFNRVKVIPIPDQSINRFWLRRKILIDEARKVPGNNLIFTIDADEMISANWASSPEWNQMLIAKPGTRFEFDWIEPFPGLEQADMYMQSAAFVDDGTEYTNLGTGIHESRIPSTNGELIKLSDIKLLHYTFIDPEKMISKHQWYKCMEYIELGKRPWGLCIMYQDTKIKSYNQPIIPVKEEWIRGYEWLNDYRINKEKIETCSWTDEEVLNYFDTYGVKKFSKLNIWDIDWNKKAQLLGRKGNYNDPRSFYEVWVHKFIEKFREDLKMKQTIPFKAIRLFGKTVLRALGW